MGVNLGTSIVLGDNQVVQVTIENLSSNGFMAKCSAMLVENTWVGVELPGGGIVRARVRWNEDGELGCQFRKPIDLEPLAPFASPQNAKPGLFGNPVRGRLAR